MNFLKKLKSSNFWVSMISAVILILQAVFNVDIKTEYLNQIILGILGLLVMSGIVTDTASNEMTVKQSVDIDSVKESLNNMFTQISATLQTDITNMISQFEKVNTTQTATSESRNETTQTQNKTNDVKNEINKTEDISSNEIKIEDLGLNEIKTEEIVEIKETANQMIVEPKVVEETKTVTQQPAIQQVNLIETNAPKNEL